MTQEARAATRVTAGVSFAAGVAVAEATGRAAFPPQAARTIRTTSGRQRMTTPSPRPHAPEAT